MTMLQQRITMGLLVGILCCGVTARVSAQQSARFQAAGSATPTLDKQADDVQMQYIKGLLDLATEYESAGETEKSAKMLKEVLKIRPNAESVKKQLDALAENAFRENQISVDVDPASGWVSSGVMVTKGKSIRLQAEGTYRLILNDTLTSDGYPSDDERKRFVAGIPFGGLMMVALPPETRNPDEKKKPKPLAPQYVGSKGEIEPVESGLLLLKLNLPPSSKPVGRIRVRISGNISK